MVEIYQQAISLTGSLNLWLILTVFAISLVAEFGFSIPYLLETIWLITGYNIIAGNLPPSYIAILCAITLVGREAGACTLYKVSGFGRTPLSRLYQKMAQDLERAPSRWSLRRYITMPVMKLAKRYLVMHAAGAGGKGRPAKAASRTFCPSTLNIVLGRFVWMKIPITITMGITKRPGRLMLGVGLFSLAWDGLYILMGAFGAGYSISPVVMILSAISLMVAVNSTLYFIRRRRSARCAAAG